jgi:Tol biopolymer transport system component
MSVAGRRTRPLTSDASSDGSAPDWSPDGARITYTGSGGLYLLNVKTGEARNLAEAWTAPVNSPTTAVFSPDGTQIAFAASSMSAYPEGEAVPRIYTVHVGGGNRGRSPTPAGTSPTGCAVEPDQVTLDEPPRRLRRCQRGSRSPRSGLICIPVSARFGEAVR